MTNLTATTSEERKGFSMSISCSELDLSTNFVRPISAMPGVSRSEIAESFKVEPLLEKLSSRHFEKIDLAFRGRELWCTMIHPERLCFDGGLLGELRCMQEALINAKRPTEASPIDFLVFGSGKPGVFNLGGDLRYFAKCIAKEDRAALRKYAQLCVDVVFENYSGYGDRCLTIALVQGDALGGGFEAALSFDFIVAEKSARFGLPESMFNLFPGMGAYSLLSRRIGISKTEEMLRSGVTYSAEEMRQIGIVDQVVNEGDGKRAVESLIAKLASNQNAQSYISQVRRRVNPLALVELRDVADLWVEAAFRLKETDLQKIEKIAAAQDRICKRAYSR